MLSSLIALIIMFFIGRAVLKWARNESKKEAEVMVEIIKYLKEGRETEDDGEGEKGEDGESKKEEDG